MPTMITMRLTRLADLHLPTLEIAYGDDPESLEAATLLDPERLFLVPFEGDGDEGAELLPGEDLLPGVERLALVDEDDHIHVVIPALGDWLDAAEEIGLFNLLVTVSLEGEDVGFRLFLVAFPFGDVLLDSGRHVLTVPDARPAWADEDADPAAARAFLESVRGTARAN